MLGMYEAECLGEHYRRDSPVAVELVIDVATDINNSHIGQSLALLFQQINQQE